MKLVILKESFISNFSKEDNQFKQKVQRPFLLIQIEHVQFLIPMSRQKGKKYSHMITENSYLYFNKCFILWNPLIIKKNYMIADNESNLSYELIKQELIIKERFTRYLVKHPTEWSIDESINKRLQNY